MGTTRAMACAAATWSDAKEHVMLFDTECSCLRISGRLFRRHLIQAQCRSVVVEMQFQVGKSDMHEHLKRYVSTVPH